MVLANESVSKFAKGEMNMNEKCPYGWCECAYWDPGDDCRAPDQGLDYCPCFDPEDYERKEFYRRLAEGKGI